MSTSSVVQTLSTTATCYLRNQSSVAADSREYNLVHSWVGPRARNLLMVGMLLTGTVGLQVASGAYRSERNSYSDEAAHFMNALLLRDYIREGLHQNPLQFATEYYLHYPKIAPGMWPPLFSTSAGLLMLLGWPAGTAPLVLLALVNAWAAWRLYRFILSFGSPVDAVVLAGVLCVIPALVDLTTAAMIDLLILALALEATYWLARFFSTGKNRHALLYGLFATLCCLSKGNGLALALLPPCLAIFTRRWDRFAQPGLYIAAAMVALVAGPPMALSFHLDAAIGDFGPLHFHDLTRRLFFYSAVLWRQLGWLMTSVSLFGLVVAVYEGTRPHGTEAAVNKAALAALAVAGLAFHLVSPHLMDSPRYIAMVFPPLLGLIPVGIDGIASRTRAKSSSGLLRTALLLAVVATFLAVTPSVALRRPLGAGATVDYIERSGGLPNSTTLVISDEYGEGAMVSEVARRHPVPRATVIRGTKFVATDDWAGGRFQMLYDSPRALLKEMEDLHVGYLVVDYSPDAIAAVRFWRLISVLIDTNGDRLERVFEANGQRRLVTYRLKYQSPGPPRPLEVPLTYSLGRVLQ
jgi:hypothetical protein